MRTRSIVIIMVLLLMSLFAIVIFHGSSPSRVYSRFTQFQQTVAAEHSDEDDDVHEIAPELPKEKASAIKNIDKVGNKRFKKGGNAVTKPEVLPKRSTPVQTPTKSQSESHSGNAPPATAPGSTNSDNTAHSNAAHAEGEEEEDEDYDITAVPLAPLAVPSDTNACVNEDFGVKLLERWYAAKKPYCTGETNMVCRKIRQARHAGDDNFCTISNVVFRPSSGELFMNCQATGDAVPSVQSRMDLFPPEMHAMIQAMRFQALPSGAEPDDTPTILAKRDCNRPYNPYHCLGDIVNIYVHLQMFGLDPLNVRILFYDDADASVWYDMYRPLAGKGVFTKQQWSTWGKDKLLTNLITNVSPGSSFVWKDFWHDSPCPLPAPLLVGFREHLHRGLGLGRHGKHGLDRIVVSLRSPAQRLKGNMNALKRLIANEAELLHGLQRAFPDREVVGIDTGILTFAEQVELIHSASMFVGMHGAGMTLMLFLRPENSTVIEFFPYMPPGEGKPKCYQNMAAWLGLPYFSWDNDDAKWETAHGMEVDVHAIVAQALHARHVTEEHKTWLHNPSLHRQHRQHEATSHGQPML